MIRYHLDEDAAIYCDYQVSSGRGRQLCTAIIRYHPEQGGSYALRLSGIIWTGRQLCTAIERSSIWSNLVWTGLQLHVTLDHTCFTWPDIVQIETQLCIAIGRSSMCSYLFRTGSQLHVAISFANKHSLGACIEWKQIPSGSIYQMETNTFWGHVSDGSCKPCHLVLPLLYWHLQVSKEWHQQPRGKVSQQLTILTITILLKPKSATSRSQPAIHRTHHYNLA